MSVMKQSVTDSISNRWFIEDTVPLVKGQLTCDNGRGEKISFFNDIKEYIALLLVHDIGSEIVQDEKLDFGKFFKSFQVIACSFF